MMELSDVKWIVFATLFVITFIFSMIPLKIVSTIRNTSDERKRARYGLLISLLSCFAGGVFMASGLLDLLPEVNDLLSKENVNLYVKSSFPVAEFTVAFGFFVILVLEQIVQDFKENQSEVRVPHGEYRRSQITNQSQDSSVGEDEEAGSNTEDVPVYQEREPNSTLQSIILLLALSMHSLFEGLAIGLQPDISVLIQLFIAVLLHKSIVSFSLGLNLVQAELSFISVMKSNFLFSIMSPLGIGIGIALEEFGHSINSSIINGILQGLACGSFVYVTFFEILPHELKLSGHRLLKVISLLLGFSVVCCVLFLDPTEPPQCLKP